MPTTTRLSLGCILGTLFLITGCAANQARPTSTASVAPIHDELPNLAIREDRQTSFRASVLKVGLRPARRPIVPKFEPIKLTDEQLAALGEQEEKDEYDLLAFYAPPKSAEHGILPIANRLNTEFYAPTRLISGTIPAPRPSGAVFFETTGQYRAGTFGRSTAAAYSELPRPARSFAEGSVTIGVAGSRSAASRAPRIDH